MLTVQVKGLEDLKRQLTGFSDRRLSAAVATALTRTGWAIRDDWKSEMQARFDAPTPLTMGAAVVKMATASDLSAEVSMRSAIPNGTPPAEYLRPHEFGGGREHKKFEKALIAQGSMPGNVYAVPTDNAQRDAFGNVRRQVLVQVLTQLAGGSVKEGYRRVISASAQRRAVAAIKAGREYIAVLQPANGLYPGIYARQKDGSLRMIFSYESRVFYRKSVTLIERGRKTAEKTLQQEVMRSVQDHIQRLAQKSK